MPESTNHLRNRCSSEWKLIQRNSSWKTEEERQALLLKTDYWSRKNVPLLLAKLTDLIEQFEIRPFTPQDDWRKT